MFTYNLDPVLFSLGPFEIRYYGLVYAFAFIAAYFILRRYSKAKKLNLTYDEIDTLLIYLILGVIIGSRLFEIIFWQPGYYFSDPIKMLYIWEGGMSFHGGLSGIIVAGLLFVRKHKVGFFELADIVAIPAMLFLALGRIANFINAELPGKITDVSWCVNFPGFDGCRHPYQLYSAAARFLIFGLLLYLSSRKFKAGFIFWNFVLLDGIARFILDFWKDDVLYFGLAMGQYLSIVMVIVAGYFLIKHHGKDFRVLS